jgi:hypothetical protein
MKNKVLRALLLSLGLLLIAFAVVLMGGSPADGAVVSSSPVYSQSVDAASALETISDSAVPLAAPVIPETLVLTQLVEPDAAPAAAQPVAQAPVAQEPVAEEPAAQEPAKEEPAKEEPVSEEPAPQELIKEELAKEKPVAEEPVVKTSAAIRLLDRANALLTQYYACANTAEKRELLGATNNSLGNDAIRTKLLADLGGSWEQLESEVVASTEYQQGKTLYVQVYMSGVSSEFVPVVYTTQNSDRSGNQWATNLVYDDTAATWMEYTQKHPYNDSRVGFYMTTLGNNEDGWEELQDTMDESPVWQPVDVPAEG